MMETSSRPRGASSGIRIRGSNSRSQSRNRHWVADHGRDPSAGPSGHGQTERWERGGIRGGRGKPRTVQSRNKSVVFNQEPETRDEYEATEEDVDLTDGMEEEEDSAEEPELETQEEREKFYQELLKAREVERKKAIAEGKMDDPLVPKRLDEAITMVGTCLDMCPRFERYRRERENNLAEWETVRRHHFYRATS
ncbi:hypothetical protein JAAARDRAFT_258913 [Jaapia argillacea MUCL 33604]|uniref:Uncharacterized protein n=1 Tax=Jaapia argillacea MUCL 33604 TaxID=933084 RepID=A0A067PTL5_9AGAM|nr:hypothetical protein JAAARDRAFT_258913 [Jaapia argillacea MUCL 33604]